MLKKIIKFGLLACVILFCLQFVFPVVQAVYNDEMAGKLFGEGLLPSPEGSNFQAMLDWLIQKNLVYYVKWMMVSISIGYLSFYGFMYITANGDEGKI